MGRYPYGRSVLDNHGSVEPELLGNDPGLGYRFAGAGNNRDTLLTKARQGGGRRLGRLGVMVQQSPIEVGVYHGGTHADTAVSCMRRTERSWPRSQVTSASWGSTAKACSVNRW